MINTGLDLHIAFVAVLPPGHHEPMHAHPQGIELIYFVDGTGTVTMQNETVAFRPRTLLLVPPGVEHDQQDGEAVTTICIILSGKDVNTFSGFWADETGIIGYTCRRLIRELSQKARGDELVCTGLTYEIAGLLTRVVHDESPVANVHPLVEKALQVIHEREGNITVSELADTLYISKDYLRHLFSEHTHRSPIQYAIELRITKAKELLTQTTHTVQDIAEECGFENVAYFSRLFKKYTEQSPSEYRRTSLEFRQGWYGG